LGWPLVFVLRHVFRLREALFTAEARGMAAVRKWDLILAKQWVTAGLLERVDDYFWLTMEEIERAIVAEDDGGVFLKPAVTARKETYRTYTEIKVPVTLKASGIPRLLLGDDFSQEVLSGTLMGLPVSPGQVQGVIKILEETDSLDQVPEGSILVAPSTDPALLPFFPLAAGLIVEVGGMLSHGSIIAREYGVPAVSNITDARTRLKSGDRVLLDGSTGVIQILEAA
jgi:pyruvate,water dikinase